MSDPAFLDQNRIGDKILLNGICGEGGGQNISCLRFDLLIGQKYFFNFELELKVFVMANGSVIIVRTRALCTNYNVVWSNLSPPHTIRVKGRIWFYSGFGFGSRSCKSQAGSAILYKIRVLNIIMVSFIFFNFLKSKIMYF